MAMLGSTIAACSGHSTNNATPADTLRIAVQQDARTLNPILASNTVDVFIQRFLFEPLVSANANGGSVAMLASVVPSTANGGISRDGLTITYHLRRNARWTDGLPVTAEDVRFSWQSIMNAANNAVSRHGYDDVSRIETPDERTVLVHLKKPFAPFVDSFFAESDQPYTIVPAHVLSHYANINRVPFNADPVVSDGPFRFASWAHGDRIVMTANNAFFMGKPHLKRIIIRVVPDENTAINLLRTGEIAYMYQPSIATYLTLSTRPGVRIVTVNMNGYEGIGLNMLHKPLNDRRVREAISYAIDKRQLVRTLTFGKERIANADLPDWMWAANPAIASENRNVPKARALLRSSGVSLPLTLVAVTESANVTHKREAVLLQSMLKDVGINLEIKTYPGDLLYAPAGAGGIVNGGSFDIAIWPWYAGIDPDNSSQFSCANLPPNGYNEARYCDPAMERLQATALTNYDRGVRAAAYHDIEVLVARDKPVIPFWWQRQLEAFSVNLHGFAPNPVVESWNAWTWSL